MKVIYDVLYRESDFFVIEYLIAVQLHSWTSKFFNCDE